MSSFSRSPGRSWPRSGGGHSHGKEDWDVDTKLVVIRELEVVEENEI